jgi:choline/glycine/proline betaine transport protein
LSALQTGSILTALPLSVIIVGMCIGLYKALNAEHQVLLRAERRQRREELAREVSAEVTGSLSTNFDQHFGERIDDRIENALPDEVETRPRPWLPAKKPRLKNWKNPR